MTFSNRFVAFVAAMLCCVGMWAFNVPIYVDNSAHVTITTAAGEGRVLNLRSGDNNVDLTLADSPLLIAPTPEGKINHIVCDAGFVFNITGPTPISFSEGSSISIYTSAETGMVTVTFSGIPSTFTAVSEGKTLDATGFNSVTRGATVDISATDGYRINEIKTQPEAPVAANGSVWTVTADDNVTIIVGTSADVDGNLMINIDNPANATVTTATGEPLILSAGDNYLDVDIMGITPLKVTPAPGATITYVANPEMLFPDAAGAYTVRLDPSAQLNQVYIATERQQSNSLTINVTDADAIRLTDNYGSEIKLADGTNSINFDFTRDNLLHVIALGEATLLGVSVDNDPQPIAENKCDFFVYRNSVVDIVTSDAVETGWINIVNEDFSGFPGGTADQPDVTTALLNEFGNFLDPSLLKPYNPNCTRGWGGHEIYAAGGALAMMNGFLNTPVGDYSGELRMTFRGRLVPGYSDTGMQGIEVLLIRDKQLVDYKRQTFTFTDQWQTFTFEADNGWYNDTRIQFFSGVDAWFEIDDVRIDHRIGSIEPPQAYYAEDMRNDSFVATWTTTDTADEYLLSVYEHGDSPETLIVDESFEGVTTDTTGHITALPEGWEYNLSAAGARTELSTDPKYAGTGSNAICFDASGDYLITPISPYKITRLTYTLAADDSANAPDQTGAILAVGALTANGWIPWINQSINFVANAGGVINVDVTENLSLLDEIYALRFEAVMAAGDNVRFMIDDIRYEAPAPPAKIYLWEDHVVEGASTTSCKVEDEAFDPEANYFYHVKARNSRYTSLPSREIEVFHAHQPEALEPTGITDSSFTALWNCGSKADMFDLTLYRTYHAEADQTEAVILDEDFGKVTSTATPDNPQPGKYTTTPVSLDAYTRIPGWSGSSYSLASGAIGGMPSKEGYMDASIVTPVMDLSNNGGSCTLYLKAWLKAGDILQIQGASTSNYAAVAWPATGWQELKVDFKNCSDTDSFTLWAGLGTPFMIDYIRLCQDLQKGDEVDIITNIYRASDPSVRSMTVDGIEQYGDYAFSYDIRSQRFYHGDKNDIYTSRPSERVQVTLDKSGIETTGCDDTMIVKNIPGGLDIILSRDANVTIYSTDGRPAAIINAAAGSNHVDLAPGVYIVTTTGATVKTAVGL